MPSDVIVIVDPPDPNGTVVSEPQLTDNNVFVDLSSMHHARFDIVIEQVQNETALILNTADHIKDVRNAYILSNGDFIIELRDGEKIRVGNLTTLLGSLPVGGQPNMLLVKTGVGDFSSEWVHVNYISTLRQDASPVLGGNLSLNGFKIQGVLDNNTLTIDGGLL